MRDVKPRINRSTLRGYLPALVRRLGRSGATLGDEVTSHTAVSRERGPAVSKRRGLDIVLVLVVLGVTLGNATGFLDTGTYTDSLDAVNVTLAALASLPLLAVRRSPLSVFVLTAVATAALSAGGAPMSFGIGPSVALYFLALNPATTPARSWLTAATVAFAFVVLAYTDRLDNSFTPEFIGILSWAAVWIVGDWIRLRRERIAEYEERALRAEREAERERRLAVAEERTRIARDLHDSAGHAINVILVQAGAARLLSERDPERARQALETIEEVARETLREIDQLVHALREGGLAGQEHGTEELSPGLAALDRLIAHNRAAGFAVSVNMRGEHKTLSPGVDQAAYRILQEALTNAARHGEGSAEMEVAFAARAVQLTVTNPTRPDWVPGGGGHGIVGMRERAALLGGGLTATGGDEVFRVTAELPYSSGRP